MHDPHDSRRGFSRRTFLKGSGAVAAATLAVAEAESTVALAQAADGNRLGPGPTPIQLSVNGKTLSTQVEPRVTLLDALRDYLDVTGCKRVCDRGTCGACTVMVDDKPIYACSMLAVDAVGKNITTDEGLGDPEKLHPIQQAFWEKDASQCGFCTPGFVVACAAALKKNPKADVDELKVALEGNICRCGTYEQMAHALEVIAKGGKA